MTDAELHAKCTALAAAGDAMAVAVLRILRREAMQADDNRQLCRLADAAERVLRSCVGTEEAFNPEGYELDEDDVEALRKVYVVAAPIVLRLDAELNTDNVYEELRRLNKQACDRNVELERLVLALAERCADQSEALTARAEKEKRA